ncbi:TPA: hypothetical protein OVU29_002553, partial [Staphylococcus aureus]|nr:hypothetical protein [Staphylococcus aureus]HCV1113483.1 hypothetical protein [Staphylococcus aureus]HEJ8144798.1 hypothetical protein [Staphylococcus aureus]
DNTYNQMFKKWQEV